MFNQTPTEILRDYLMRDHLLHGSRFKLEILEPQQATCSSGRPQGNLKAVYATFSHRIAMFMAARHPTNPKDWSTYYHQKNDTFVAGGRNATLGPGYVYVLPGDTFKCVGTEDDMEIVSFSPVIPVAVVLVRPEDVRKLDIEFQGALA